MRRRLAFTRDTLQAHLLPPTEYMELNYRPALPRPGALWTTTLLQAYAIVAGVAVLFGAIEFAMPYQRVLWFILSGVSPWILLIGAFHGPALLSRWTPKQFFRRGLIALLSGSIVIGCVWLSPSACWVFAPLTAVTLAFSYFSAKQFAYWTTVHGRVDWQEMQTWQMLWSRLLTWLTPPECPEMRTSRLATLVVIAQACLSFAVVTTLSKSSAPATIRSAASLMAIVTLLLPLPFYWIVWHLIGGVPKLSLSVTLRSTCRAIGVWFGYLRTPTPAPGVFLFPDKWLRSFAVRELVAILVLTTVTSGLLVLPHDPSELAPVALYREVLELVFGGLSDSAWSLLQVPAAAAVTISIPLIVVFAITWFVMGDVIARYWLAFEAPGAYGRSSKSAWAISVNRMLNSKDTLEREHVLLGRAIFGDYPVLLHKPLLYQHAHLVGDSGSRKTSLGIAPLIAQLVAAKDCSVLVLDLKGDRALFDTARKEAQVAKAEFRWFSLEAEHSSHVFNPLEQSHFARITPNQKTQLILEGLSLNYGEAYGRGFYSAMNEVVLLNLLRNYPATNFRKLHELLNDKQAYAAVGNPKDWDKAQHLTALVDRLASIHALNVTERELAELPAVQAAAIDMGKLMSRSQVVYFYLKSPVEPIGAPAVAKLAMRSLFTAAAHRLPKQTNRVYVVIDEFQQVVSESVQLVLEQARGNDVHFIIAHQNIEQLDRKGIDVRSTVSSCTAFKQFFRASDPLTIRQLEELSGEGMFESLTWRQSLPPTAGFDQDGGYSPMLAEDAIVQVMETPGYRLERNTIMDISALPNTSFVNFTEGSKFTQFSGYVTPIISDYHIDLQEYKQRNLAAWPMQDAETVTNPSVVDAALRMAAQPSPPHIDEALQQWNERLRNASGADAPNERD